jgi:Mg-chelatase subunit ChlI
VTYERTCYRCGEPLPALPPDATFADEMAAPSMHPACQAERDALNAQRAHLERAALAGGSTLTADDYARVAEAFLSSWHRRAEDDADGHAVFHPRRPELAAIASQSEAVRWLQAETSRAAGKHRGQGTGAGLWWDTYTVAARGLFVVDTTAGRSGVVSWAYV